MTAPASGREYYQEELAFFTAVRDVGFRAKTVFDVGSSHGGWSYAISSIFPNAEFHLFEPLADLKPDYRERNSQILAEKSSFALHKVAIGAQNGSITMISDPQGFGASTMARKPFAQFQERHRVPILRLDAFVERAQLSAPEIVKMDLQGGELNALRGAKQLLEQIRIIQLEAWMYRAYSEKHPLFWELGRFLAKKQFCLVEIGERFYSRRHQLIALDAFFVREDVLDLLGKSLGRERLTP
jgi:FkbM family methyltransferase